MTDSEVRKTLPADRPLKLFDGSGLYLLINPNGSRWWRLKFRVAGTEKLLSLGVYPAVSLKAARERREELRKQLRAGSDPSLQRQATKHLQAIATENSLAAVAEEWLALHRKRLSVASLKKHRWMLDTYLIPPQVTEQQLQALMRTSGLENTVSNIVLRALQRSRTLTGG